MQGDDGASVRGRTPAGGGRRQVDSGVQSLEQGSALELGRRREDSYITRDGYQAERIVILTTRDGCQA